MAAVTAALVKQLRDQTGAGMMDCKAALTETDGDFEAAVDWLRKKGLAAAAKKAGRVASQGLVGVAVSGRRGAMVEVNSETDFVARNQEFQSARAHDRAAGARARRRPRAPDAGHGARQRAQRGGRDHAGDRGDRREHQPAPERGGRGRRKAWSAPTCTARWRRGSARSASWSGCTRPATPSGSSALGKQLAMHVAAARPQAVSIDRLDAATLERERAIYADQARASGKPDNIIDKIVEGRVRKFYEEAVLLEQPFVIDPDLKIKDAIDRVAEEIGSSIAVTEFVRFALGEGLTGPGVRTWPRRWRSWRAASRRARRRPSAVNDRVTGSA